MLAFVKARYTVGLIGLDIIDRAKVNIILEKAFADGEASWLALYNDSCDLIITTRDHHIQAMDEQIVARIVDEDVEDDGPFLLRRPLTHEAIVNLLRLAESQLDTSAPAPEYGRLRVTGVTEEKRINENAQRGGFDRATEVAGIETAEAEMAGAANSSVFAREGTAGPSHGGEARSPVPAPAWTMQAPRSAAPMAQPMPRPSSPDAGSETFGESWGDIAIALYSILQNRIPTLARISMPHADPILIDFHARVFQCAGFPDAIPLEPSSIVLRASLVQPDQAEPRSGQPLDRLLWFIGTRTLGNTLAPWLCAEDRFRLVQWPNFTVLDHTIDHMRMTAAMGNGQLTVNELAQLAGVPNDKAVGMINAFSLMGLLHIERQPAPRPRVPAPDAEHRAAAKSSGSLFGKLIRKMGL